MKKQWKGVKNILCIRMDNMGDLLMTSPAIRALKTSYGSRITVLTSSAGAGIARQIEGIDEVMVADAPWVKSEEKGNIDYSSIIEALREKAFDAAVIFTVCSQNPLPAVLLAYLAGIPNRLAYCRENPYDLLTSWVSEKEPYTFLLHQVERDLALVKTIGAESVDCGMRISVPAGAYTDVLKKLERTRRGSGRPWIMVHPGASETKRMYPAEKFRALLKKIIDQLGVDIVLTGTENEKHLLENLMVGSTEQDRGMYHPLAGEFSLPQFTALVDLAPVVLSVNTGTVHIAAALGTPVVVLYANSNPQHTPWQVDNEVFMFPASARSRNEVVRYIQDHLMPQHIEYPDHDQIVLRLANMLKIAPRQPVPPF